MNTILAAVAAFIAASAAGSSPPRLRAAAPASPQGDVAVPLPLRAALRRQSVQRLDTAPGDQYAAAPTIETVFRRYGDGLRYFNPRLTAADASQLARSLIAFSNRFGIDARLAVAIFVAEGSVRRVHPRAGTLEMDGRPAGERIEQLCRDFRRRLEAAGDGATPTLAEIQRALAARAAARAPQSGPRGAERYAKRVMLLYKQLCGAE